MGHGLVALHLPVRDSYALGDGVLGSGSHRVWDFMVCESRSAVPCIRTEKPAAVCKRLMLSSTLNPKPKTLKPYITVNSSIPCDMTP